VWLPRAARLARAARVAPRPTASLTPLAFRQPASPTAPSPGPPSCRPDRLARRSPVAVMLRRRLCAGEPQFPAVSRAPAPCRHRLAEQRRRRAARRRVVPPPRAHAVHRALRRPAELGHQLRARCAGRGRGPRTWAAPAPRTWAALALCDWAERDFGPVATG
jgi:hypothetical protein